MGAGLGLGLEVCGNTSLDFKPNTFLVSAVKSNRAFGRVPVPIPVLFRYRVRGLLIAIARLCLGASLRGRFGFALV